MKIVYTHTGRKGRPRGNFQAAYLEKVGQMANGEGYTMPIAHRKYFEEACREIGRNFTFKKLDRNPKTITGYSHTWDSKPPSERLAAVKVVSDVPVPDIRNDTIENLIHGLKQGESFEIEHSYKDEIVDTCKRLGVQFVTRNERFEDNKLLIRVWRIK